MSILFVFVALSLLVIIHELAHFLVAKYFKMDVEEFGLGYPPKLIKLFTFKDTEFSLNAIPFGGFVRLYGEDWSEETDKKNHSKKIAFYEHGAKKKMLVITAGPIINFLYGVLAITILSFVFGIPIYLKDQARIAEIAPNSPAALAKLPTEVNILALVVNGERINTKTISEVQNLVAAHKGEEVTIIVSGHCQELICDRVESSYTLKIRSTTETPAGEGSLGVYFSDYFLKKDFPWYLRPIKSIVYAMGEGIRVVMMILQALARIITDLLLKGLLPKEVAGPIGIIHQAQKQEIYKEGFFGFINFSGMLSINLAVMNLLPIPALDGGRALFIFLEKTLGKKKIKKVEAYVNYLGFVFLLLLISVVTIADIIRIFRG